MKMVPCILMILENFQSWIMMIVILMLQIIFLKENSTRLMEHLMIYLEIYRSNLNGLFSLVLILILMMILFIWKHLIFKSSCNASRMTCAQATSIEMRMEAVMNVTRDVSRAQDLEKQTASHVLCDRIQLMADALEKWAIPKSSQEL